MERKTFFTVLFGGLLGFKLQPSAPPECARKDRNDIVCKIQHDGVTYACGFEISTPEDNKKLAHDLSRLTEDKLLEILGIGPFENLS